MCTEIEAHEKVIEGLLGGLAQKNPKVLSRISRQTFYIKFTQRNIDIINIIVKLG